MKDLIEPPSLPVWNTEGPVRVMSTWDILAQTIMDSHVHRVRGEDSRVRWKRFLWLHWHCGKRMRLALMEDKVGKFGWTNAIFHRHAACQRCGYLKTLL